MSDDPPRDDAEAPAPPPPVAGPRERPLGFAMLATAVVTGALLVGHGDWDDPGWWMTAPFVGVWLCVPYAWMGRTLRASREHDAGTNLATLGTLAGLAVAGWVLWQYHFTDGARGGRVFMLLPIWQGLAFAPFALLAHWLRPRAGG